MGHERDAGGNGAAADSCAELPLRLRRFREDEWPEIPTGSRGFVGPGRARVVRDRRRQAWHLARCAWAVEHGVDVADLPDDT